MSDIGEAVGTAIEGGLIARVVGGKRGALVDKDGHPVENGHFAEGECLNCGTELTGAHCHTCGQKAHLHRTIGAFLHDLLHGALHLDGKTWRTLPLLIRKPGELTRRYIEGERARFVSPMAMFLFSVFLMFAVFQALGISAPTEIPGDATAQIRNIAATEVERLGERRAQLVENLADTELTEAERNTFEEQLAELDEQLEGIKRAEQEVPFFSNITDPDEEIPELTMNGIPVVENADGTSTIPLSPDGKAKMRVGSTGVDWIDDGINKWRTNPGLMLYKMQANAYKFSWLLIPLSIPFVWLLFAWKRRFKAYDHAIFATYSLSFMSLLFIALSVLGMTGILGGWAFLFLVIIPPIHIYKHLRGAYGLSRFSAFWRLIALMIFIFIVLTLFVQILAIMGAF